MFDFLAIKWLVWHFVLCTYAKKNKSGFENKTLLIHINSVTNFTFQSHDRSLNSDSKRSRSVDYRESDVEEHNVISYVYYNYENCF